MLLSTLSEIASMGLSGYLIELKSFGRTKSLSLAYGLGGIFLLITHIFLSTSTLFIYFISIGKFFITMTFVLYY